jgi:hypothetical protein
MTAKIMAMKSNINVISMAMAGNNVIAMSAGQYQLKIMA